MYDNVNCREIQKNYLASYLVFPAVGDIPALRMYDFRFMQKTCFPPRKIKLLKFKTNEIFYPCSCTYCA